MGGTLLRLAFPTLDIVSFSNRFSGHGNVAEQCGCPVAHFDEPRTKWKSTFHLDTQDTESEAWNQLLALVDHAANTGAIAFEPGRELGPDLWKDIVTLPKTISQLNKVTSLNLYGSNLRSIPAEIGGMTALQIFVPYTSYRLHWFPFEITRCTNLVDSTVSTRALYGNYKFRPSFPELPAELTADVLPEVCSVCDGTFAESGPIQRWVSLRAASDVLPLLAHACSLECVAKLPKPAEGYVDVPHQGGVGLHQPDGD